MHLHNCSSTIRLNRSLVTRNLTRFNICKSDLGCENVKICLIMIEEYNGTKRCCLLNSTDTSTKYIHSRAICQYLLQYAFARLQLNNACQPVSCNKKFDALICNFDLGCEKCKQMPHSYIRGVEW